MDWRDAYRSLKKKGYLLALPSSNHRQDFRKKIQEQHGLSPIESKVRIIYILGKDGVRDKEFFQNNDMTKQMNRDVKDISARIQKKDSSYQYHGYLYHKQDSPADLVARRLCVGQGNIEFIAPLPEIFIGVYATWKDSRK